MNVFALILLLVVVAVAFHEGKSTKLEKANKEEIEDIKKSIDTMKMQIKVIKVLKKDMDEKEWEIKL